MDVEYLQFDDDVEACIDVFKRFSIQNQGDLVSAAFVGGMLMVGSTPEQRVEIAHHLQEKREHMDNKQDLYSFWLQLQIIQRDNGKETKPLTDWLNEHPHLLPESNGPPKGLDMLNVAVVDGKSVCRISTEYMSQ